MPAQAPDIPLAKSAIVQTTPQGSAGVRRVRFPLGPLRVRFGVRWVHDKDPADPKTDPEADLEENGPGKQWTH